MASDQIAQADNVAYENLPLSLVSIRKPEIVGLCDSGTCNPSIPNYTMLRPCLVAEMKRFRLL